MIRKTELAQFGMTLTEAAVYIEIAKSRRTDAKQIIKQTGLHRRVVYDAITKLITKGFAAQIKTGNKQLFSITSPEALTNYVKRQKEELNQKEKLAKEIEEQILLEKKEEVTESNASLYEGIQSIKAFYHETLLGGDYQVIGAPKSSVEIMGEIFWENYHLKRRESKIKIKLLINESLRNWGSKQIDNKTEVKYLDKEMEPETEIHIQNESVAIIIWNKMPSILKISNKTVAESYKQYFQKLWKISQK